MTTSDLALIDTNVLVYAMDNSSPYYTESKTLVEKGRKGELSLCVTPQILCEFYAVVTDSKRIKKPITRQEAIHELNRFIRSQNIRVIYVTSLVTKKILELLDQYPVVKQDIFDLKLVATMLSNNVTKLYTYNRSDFEQFTEIEVLSPQSTVV